ncbi:hypothetical protein Tco_0583786 [Tanacetum coccineum]
MHIRNDPSFFLTNKIGAPQGEELGLIKPLIQECGKSHVARRGKVRKVTLDKTVRKSADNERDRPHKVQRSEEVAFDWCLWHGRWPVRGVNMVLEKKAAGRRTCWESEKWGERKRAVREGEVWDGQVFIESEEGGGGKGGWDWGGDVMDVSVLFSVVLQYGLPIRRDETRFCLESVFTNPGNSQFLKMVGWASNYGSRAFCGVEFAVPFRDTSLNFCTNIFCKPHCVVSSLLQSPTSRLVCASDEGSSVVVTCIGEIMLVICGTGVEPPGYAFYLDRQASESCSQPVLYVTSTFSYLCCAFRFLWKIEVVWMHGVVELTSISSTDQLLITVKDSVNICRCVLKLIILDPGFHSDLYIPVLRQVRDEMCPSRETIFWNARPSPAMALENQLDGKIPPGKRRTPPSSISSKSDVVGETEKETRRTENEA